jgi:hypothetical protein
MHSVGVVVLHHFLHNPFSNVHTYLLTIDSLCLTHLQSHALVKVFRIAGGVCAPIQEFNYYNRCAIPPHYASSPLYSALPGATPSPTFGGTVKPTQNVFGGGSGPRGANSYAKRGRATMPVALDGEGDADADGGGGVDVRQDQWEGREEGAGGSSNGDGEEEGDDSTDVYATFRRQEAKAEADARGSRSSGGGSGRAEGEGEAETAGNTAHREDEERRGTEEKEEEEDEEEEVEERDEGGDEGAGSREGGEEGPASIGSDDVVDLRELAAAAAGGAGGVGGSGHGLLGHLLKSRRPPVPLTAATTTTAAAAPTGVEEQKGEQKGEGEWQAMETHGIDAADLAAP